MKRFYSTIRHSQRATPAAAVYGKIKTRRNAFAQPQISQWYEKIQRIRARWIQIYPVHKKASCIILAQFLPNSCCFCSRSIASIKAHARNCPLQTSACQEQETQQE